MSDISQITSKKGKNKQKPGQSSSLAGGITSTSVLQPNATKPPTNPSSQNTSSQATRAS